MADKETPKDSKPELSVAISLTDVQKIIAGVKADGRVTLSKPNSKGAIDVTIRATSKAGPDHPHKGRLYPVFASFTIPEYVVDTDEKKFAFVKAGYTAGLGHSTTYRATEEGTKPKQVGKAADTVEAQRTMLVESGVDEAAIDAIVEALRDKATTK